MSPKSFFDILIPFEILIIFLVLAVAKRMDLIWKKRKPEVLLPEPENILTPNSYKEALKPLSNLSSFEFKQKGNSINRIYIFFSPNYMENKITMDVEINWRFNGVSSKRFEDKTIEETIAKVNVFMDELQVEFDSVPQPQKEENSEKIEA